MQQNKWFHKNKHKLLICLITALFACASTAAVANQQAVPEEPSEITATHVLPSFFAEYQVLRKHSPIGNASIRFYQKSSHYVLEYRSKVSRYFLTDRRYEKTTYAFAPQPSDAAIPLTPLQYEYFRSGTGPDDKLHIDFVNKIINGEDEQSTFTPDYLDNQFFRLDIPYLLARNQPLPNYTFLNYRGSEREYEITLVGEETVRLPIGMTNTIKIKITRPSSDRRVTYAWFSPDYDFQIVRLQQFKDDGEQADMRLSKFTVDAIL